MHKLTIEVLTPGFPIVDGQDITLQGSKIRVRGLSAPDEKESIITLSPGITPESYGQMASAILSRTRQTDVKFEVIYPDEDNILAGIRAEQPKNAALRMLKTGRFPWRRTLLFWKK